MLFIYKSLAGDFAAGQADDGLQSVFQREILFLREAGGVGALDRLVGIETGRTVTVISGDRVIGAARHVDVQRLGQQQAGDMGRCPSRRRATTRNKHR